MASAPTTATDEHQAAVDLDRVAQPIDGLDQHPDSDRHQQQRVAEGRQDLGTLQAKGAFHSCGPGRQGGRDERQDQAGGVGQHMAGVCEQGERTCDESADYLSDQHRAGDHEYDDEPFPVLAGGGHLMAMYAAHLPYLLPRLQC